MRLPGRSYTGSAGRRRGLHPLVMAAIPIFATIFITYYAFSQQLPFSHEFTLHALVGNSVNVRSDSPVRIAGVDVGTVQGTAPRDRQTEITFTVSDEGRPIHADATIRIRDRLFLEGGYYVELDPGTPGAPIVGDGHMFPRSQASSPVQFFQLLSTFDAPTRNSLADTFDTLNEGFSQTPPGRPLSDSGAGSFKQTIPQLTPGLVDIARITRALQGTRAGDVGRLLTSSSSVTSTLAGSSADLVSLVTSLDRTATALAATDGSLADSVSSLDQTLQAAPPALTSIDAALPPVTRLAAALDPSLKLAPPILTGVTQAVRDLEAIVAPAARGHLLTTLKATFTQFPALLTKLGSLFPIARGVTDCLRTHVTPILESVVPDANLSSGRPVWQDFIHFLPNLVSTGQNFDGNGHWVRLMFSGGASNEVSLGSLPGIGQVLGTAPSSSSNSAIQGVRPVWQGTLSPDAFHPEAACADQKVPSLVSAGAAPDERPIHAGSTPAGRRLTLADVRRALEKAVRKR
jgi:phospholipid/cholesterol/gamma-HCH transport system substrate-binding protein